MWINKTQGARLVVLNATLAFGTLTAALLALLLQGLGDMRGGDFAVGVLQGTAALWAVVFFFLIMWLVLHTLARDSVLDQPPQDRSPLA